MRIINFVSLAPNIGNYTPVLGIGRLLGDDASKIVARADCRQFEAIRVEDFELAIVGGAGLLHACFEGFWRWLAQQTIPVVIWGVGVCLNYDTVPLPSRLRSGVSPGLLRELKPQIVAANVRDDLTAEMYDLDAEVGYCPTIAWLRELKTYQLIPDKLGGRLYVEHPELTTSSEAAQLRAVCTDYTDNTVRNDIGNLLMKYLTANTIVTTRLHGAIIANCLGKPYVALAKDKKVDAYHRRWGGGVVMHRPQLLEEALDEVESGCYLPRPDLNSVQRFAGKVRAIIRAAS